MRTYTLAEEAEFAARVERAKGYRFPVHIDEMRKTFRKSHSYLVAKYTTKLCADELEAMFVVWCEKYNAEIRKKG